MLFQHRNNLVAFGCCCIYFPAFGPAFSTGFESCQVLALIGFIAEFIVTRIHCLRAPRDEILLTVQVEIGRVRSGLEVPPLLLNHRAVDPLSTAHCPGGGIGRRASFRCWLSKGSGGSSPLLGTISIKKPAVGGFFFGAQVKPRHRTGLSSEMCTRPGSRGFDFFIKQANETLSVVRKNRGR